MDYQTDDPAHRVKFLWHGNVDTPWWFDARGVMWVLAGFLTVLFTVLFFLVLPSGVFAVWIIPGVIIKALVCLAGGVVCAVLTTRWFGRKVTAETPIRHHITTVTRELSTPRPESGAVRYLTTVPPETAVENYDARLYVTKDDHA